MNTLSIHQVSKLQWAQNHKKEQTLSVEKDNFSSSSSSPVYKLQQRWLQLTQNMLAFYTNQQKSSGLVHDNFSQEIVRILIEAKHLQNLVHFEEKELLVPLIKKFRIADKWVNSGFDPTLLVTDYTAVEFAVTTQLIYTVNMYKNSASSLLGPVMTIQNRNGKAYVLKEGEYFPLTEIIQQIGSSDNIVFRAEGDFERYRGWMFTHPSGFIRKDLFDWDDIRHIPIAMLSSQAIKNIFKKAQANPTEVPYVLQIIVTKTNIISSTGITKKLSDIIWLHSHVLIIHRSGSVWSASTLMKKEEYNQVINGLSSYYAMNANTKINSIDYSLAKNRCHHFASYFPMTDESANKVFEYINRSNQGVGQRFNLMSHNCTRFAIDILHLLGYTPSVKESVIQTLMKIVPDIEDIPGIGLTLYFLSQRIKKIYRPIEEFFARHLPSIPVPITSQITAIWHKACHLIGYFPRQGIVFIFNCVAAYKYGGAQAAFYSESGKNIKVYTTVWDYFNEENLQIYHGYLLKKWLEEHKDRYYDFSCQDRATLPINPTSIAPLL